MNCIQVNVRDCKACPFFHHYDYRVGESTECLLMKALGGKLAMTADQKEAPPGCPARNPGTVIEDDTPRM